MNKSLTNKITVRLSQSQLNKLHKLATNSNVAPSVELRLLLINADKFKLKQINKLQNLHSKDISFLERIYGILYRDGGNLNQLAKHGYSNSHSLAVINKHITDFTDYIRALESEVMQIWNKDDRP